jgi:hypothetical protein
MSALANAANILNAKLSTGPTSPEGKDRVKFNALKSGLFARTVVLPGEQQSDYETLGTHLTGQYRPQSDPERELVITVQNTTWRLNRAVELEFGLYAISTQQQMESIEAQFGDQTPEARRAIAQAAGYLANARAFDQLNRQEGRLQRLLDRTKRELNALIASRVPPPEPAKQAEAPPAAPPAQPTAQPQNGFVPRKYPKHMPTFTGPNAKTYRSMWLQKNGFANLA